MAANFTVSVDEVSCPVCHDIFTCPVVLSCSHSLCKDCLQQCRTAGFHKCPLCQRACPPGTEPPVNRALKNLCERFHLEQEVAGGSETLCGRHGEKLKLFCLVDKQPICADCVPDLHDRHKCCHLKVAVHDHKMRMQAALKPLQEKLENFKKISETRDQKLHHIKSQVQQTEKQIKEEFQELHQFLHQEEAARIAALRAEETQRSQTLSRKMEEVVRKMKALSTTVKAIEQEMGKDDVSFLQNYNATMKQTQCTVQDPDVSGVLIDVAKHLGNLKFQVWQTMTGMVKHTPVILDPNTAGPFLIFSKDLTSVTSSKAYSTNANTLFGSQGFSSGKHQWDVEFHRYTFIDIGIAEECQKERWSNDEHHVCTVRHCGGYVQISEKSVRRGMLLIRVLLDCDEKTLSFFDVYGNKTFQTGCRYTLTGKLFPLFYFFEINNYLNLKILPAKIKVMQKKVQ
ncbi:E3 ubiquitin-protein ligase TRIM35-like isoform X1 [Conger conger]|uniref:E3 ubiquitin-protein ligase TRIM35-like isoform X1 n=2 Tax=Conger conger TaxID=82655 RepID=UPI002A599407|nr:E3 ubiquitin-protein ligase TRIM35-like isoform X1 [Conger conger]